MSDKLTLYLREEIADRPYAEIKAPKFAEPETLSKPISVNEGYSTPESSLQPNNVKKDDSQRTVVPETYPSSGPRENVDSNRASLFLTGAATYTILLAIIYLTTIPGIISWNTALTNQLAQFAAPQIARWLFTIAVVSLFWLTAYILLRIGGKITLKAGNLLEAESETVNIKHPLISAMFGIPVWFVTILMLGAAAGLFTIRPSCQAPSIAFTNPNSGEFITPNEIIKLNPGEALILTAKSAETPEQTIRCKWSFTGNLISSLEQPNACTTTIYTSNIQENALVSVSASKEFCDRATTASITISTNQP